MADWRQIQARIRKAKAGTDAVAKLAELYERTRDAMVAFELAQWQEKAGDFADAARWYTAAAERFRRSQWKTKAEAALARLRSPSAAGTESAQGESARAQQAEESLAVGESERPEFTETSRVPEVEADIETHEAASSTSRSEAIPQQPSADEAETNRQTGASATSPGGQQRRRSRRGGRRGGRRHRETGSRSTVAAPQAQLEAPPLESTPAAPAPVVESKQGLDQNAAPELQSSSAGATATWRSRSRAGEPALASRMAQLESQLRRLLACPQARLDQAETAPAGPGVLLLSDSEQVTNYYIEDCQTLRIAVGNLIRGSRQSKDLPRLKERLAENLGIPESRVANYLKEHCAVRWLQLDDGASALAHFAIAVLRPIANE